MDGLLRGKKSVEVEENTNFIEELFKKSFDFENNFVLFPVRHHSPACSFHIVKAIEEYEPDAILIEGPENACDIIDFIVSDESKAPFCIYLSFDDKNGIISEEKEKYKVYYPFLDFSPELVGLRQGRAKGLHCSFIDLSYGEKLINTPKPADKSDVDYDNDREFIQSKYYKALIERTGCKSFNELWEMLFEIDGCHKDTREFVRSLFYYCFYSRKNTEKDELLYQGDIIREYKMAENIKKSLEKYKKVFVITGGIHTVELVNLLNAEKLPNYKIKSASKEESPAYFMPYSYEESDQNSGYNSGMVFPYFYQRVWENIIKGNKKPFEDTALRFIINTAGIVRKKQTLSISDEMQSYYMARGLSELRGKKECGVFELIDAIKSSFVKGEIGSFQQPALKTLYRLMTGMEMGVVDKRSGVPPIVNDFLENCKRFKIQTNTSLKKESKLDVYNNEQHREKSRFFYCMNFLRTGFCARRSSQDSNTKGVGRILLRETWEYQSSPKVQVELISNSAYGATLRQACVTLILKEINGQHINACELSKNLLRANNMGLNEIYGEFSGKFEDIITQDMDFLSVTDCLKNLCYVKNYREITDGLDMIPLDKILEINIGRIITLMYTIMQIKKEDEDKICEAIKFIYSYFIDNSNTVYEDSFMQSIESMYSDISTNGALAGMSTGILLKKGKFDVDRVIFKFESYINGTDDAKKMSASFLKGFFAIAKDIVFVDDRLITSLDGILKDTDGDIFLEILPDLRLAFTYFLPFETDKIAKKISEIYNVSESEILYQEMLEPSEMEIASDIDKLCYENIVQWINPDFVKEV